MQNMWILAQTEQVEGQSEVSAEPVAQQDQTQTMTAADSNMPEQVTARKPASPYGQLIFIVAIFLIMYFILFREPKKRQKRQQQMVQSLKKNDKVRTIGGIIGTVVDIKGDEIVLKVDESNNTKIRIATSAVGKNLSSEGQ